MRHVLVGLALAEQVWPFMQVWLEIAARGAAVFRTTGHRIASSFLDWIASQSAAPTDAGRREVAARLLPLVDGLILLEAVDLAETCAAGWAHAGPR